MTLTVKLEPDLEQALDARSAALKQPRSRLVREALRLYLRESASPFDLGRDLFARHAGPADLAEKRKHYLTRALSEKHRSR